MLPYETFDEQSAWTLIRQGDKAAFLQLYEHFFHYLLQIGIRISNDPHAAKDACQDYFLYLWEKRDTLSEVRNIKGYLYKGYKNQLVKMILKKGKTLSFSPEDDDGQRSWEPGRETEAILSEEAREKRDLVIRAFKALPPRQRELVYLRYYAALPIEEIARATGLTLRSVYNQLHIAHNKLRESLNKKDRNSLGSIFLLLW
ncbi:MAG: hypothetical protein BGO55_31490 [Sphingobacteriales bacterium 50-39]|nr:RNA polymerase sigma factor [Sphingobacteriales bacterium]OJW61026.1 MAG: hypothetical protein BGO55_31490 [Sphingobacteriales bacterium 50-39]